MDKILTIFTFFALLVSTARPVVDSPATIPSTVEAKHASTGSNIVLPGENIKSDSNETINTNRLLPHTNFAKFHPVNRHFSEKSHRRPCRKHMRQYHIPRNDIMTVRSEDTKPKSFRGEVPSNWLKMKHHYYARHHRSNTHNRNKNEGVIKTKNVINREKLKSLIREGEQKKKREEEAKLMKGIRKFLKHTFD